MRIAMIAYRVGGASQQRVPLTSLTPPDHPTSAIRVRGHGQTGTEARSRPTPSALACLTVSITIGTCLKRPSGPRGGGAVLVDPWDPRDARLLRKIENGWLSLARRITGLQDAPLTDMQGNHLVGVRVLDGWQDQVRPFLQSWDPKWDPQPRKPKSAIGAAEWEGH